MSLNVEVLGFLIYPHGLSRSPAPPCSNLRCRIHPVLLARDRAQGIQRRVRACLVISEQSGNNFVLGFADGFEKLAMVPLDLQ